MPVYQSPRSSAKLLGLLLFTGALILSWRNFQSSFQTQKTITSSIRDFKAEKCQPQENVLFLKTHKTGSSTITNILNRYCDKNDLTMALPQEGIFSFFWPIPFDTSFIAPERTQVNILCNHARFSKSMVTLMPKNTKFITILRNPVSQFESLFSYMEFGSLLGLEDRKNPIDAFMDDPLNHVASLTKVSSEFLIEYPYINLLKNGQFFDLGLDGEDVPDYEEKIQKSISELEKQFHLVLIMEYFDESLVLLAKELCWTLEDVLYFKQNRRRLDDKSVKLSKKAVFNLKEWNKAEFMLYNHFNKTFWRKVRQQDRTFWTQVNLLRAYNKVLERGCLEPGEHVGKVYENQSKSVQGFKLKKTLNPELLQICNRMVTSEINYIKYFREKQKVKKSLRRKLMLSQIPIRR